MCSCHFQLSILLLRAALAINISCFPSSWGSWRQVEASNINTYKDEQNKAHSKPRLIVVTGRRSRKVSKVTTCILLHRTQLQMFSLHLYVQWSGFFFSKHRGGAGRVAAFIQSLHLYVYSLSLSVFFKQFPRNTFSTRFPSQNYSINHFLLTFHLLQ